MQFHHVVLYATVDTAAKNEHGHVGVAGHVDAANEHDCHVVHAHQQDLHEHLQCDLVHNGHNQ